VVAEIITVKACFHQMRFVARFPQALYSSLLDKPFAKSQCLLKSHDKLQIAFGGNSATVVFSICDFQLILSIGNE
jgi:hypothetical protein